MTTLISDEARSCTKRWGGKANEFRSESLKLFLVGLRQAELRGL